MTESESVLKDPNGEVYVRLHVRLSNSSRSYAEFMAISLTFSLFTQSGMFNVGVYTSGASPPPPSQYFSKRISSPPAAKKIPKDRKPDWVVLNATTERQALVYRLSGDYNPLHVGQCKP